MTPAAALAAGLKIDADAVPKMSSIKWRLIESGALISDIRQLPLLNL